MIKVHELINLSGDVLFDINDITIYLQKDDLFLPKLKVENWEQFYEVDPCSEYELDITFSKKGHYYFSASTIKEAKEKLERIRFSINKKRSNIQDLFQCLKNKDLKIFKNKELRKIHELFFNMEDPVSEDNEEFEMKVFNYINKN